MGQVCGSLVKNSPANAGAVGSIPGLGRYRWRRKWQRQPYSSILAQKNLMDRGAWQATVPGVLRVGCDLVTEQQSNFKISAQQRKSSTEQKHNLQIGGKYLQTMQYVQIACTTQYKKYEPNQKTGRRPKQTFLQRRQTAGQQVSKKMLDTADYQRNANQNHNRVSPHMGQNSYHHSINSKCWRVCGKKGTFIHCWCSSCSSSVSLLVVSDSFATPWTTACQASLSTEFSRQDYWSG